MSDAEDYDYVSDEFAKPNRKLISRFGTLKVHYEPDVAERSISKFYRLIKRLEPDNVKQQIDDFIRVGKEYDYPQIFEDTLLENYESDKRKPLTRSQQRLALSKFSNIPNDLIEKIGLEGVPIDKDVIKRTKIEEDERHRRSHAKMKKRKSSRKKKRKSSHKKKRKSSRKKKRKTTHQRKRAT